MFLLKVILAITALITFLIGLYVFVKNGGSVVNRSFFIFSTGIALWGGSLLLLSITHSPIFVQCILYGGVLMILGFVLLAKTFPDARFLKKSFLLNLIPLCAICFAIPFHAIVEKAIVHPNGMVEPVNGPLFPIFVFVVCLYVLWGLYLFTRTYRATSGFKRLQMQYLFMGAALFIVFAIVSDAILPAFGIFSLNLIGPIASIIFVGFTGYAIIRHQLMDIRIVIQRGVMYSLLLILIAGIYLIIIFFMGTALKTTENISVFTAAVLTTIFGILGWPYIENYFRKVTDRIFFKDHYKYSEAMHELSEIINKNIDFETLSYQICKALKKIMKTDDAHITFTINPGIDIDDSDYLVMPIILENRTLGNVVLGKKLSGDAYMSEDIDLLRTFAFQAAVAFEKARLYQKVIDHARELEEKVNERTATLIQLREREQQMLMDISHGLQTPLTVMKGEIGFIKKQKSYPKVVDFLENSMDKVSRFIYDLLRLAKLESGTDELNKEPIHFSAFLKDILEYVDTITQEKHISITTSLNRNIYIAGNKNKLEEMITNIISNAIKYTETARHKNIHVELKKDSDLCTLTIADTGIGISPENLPFIFERFYRIINDNKGMEGSGLGLAIAKKIVELHKGTIEATSIPGEGTIFSIRLPLLNLR